jgi:folate-binding protein YgfZ
MSRRLPADSPTLLSFRGPDAVRYLNGQLTQDIRGLENRALPACVTDAKGRLQFMVTVFRGTADDEILIAGQPGHAEELRARLERYLIADDVETADLGGQWIRVHADTALEGAAFSRDAQGPFGPGIDHWYPAGAEPGGPALGADDIETLRIEAGLPAWGREIEAGMLPPEAGLDRTAISYNKGCYIGQEVISRIKSAGRLNRRLARFRTTTTAPGPLLADGEAVGELTSVAPLAAADGTRAALGYLRKQGFESDRFELEDGGEAQRLGWA